MPAINPAWIIPDWPAPPGVRALVTTRLCPGQSPPPYARCNLGLRSGDAADHVQANRHGLIHALNLPAAPVWLQQVHGTDVVEIVSPLESEPMADAAVTRAAGLPLAILSADCLPVLLCTRDGSTLGAAHAGWRGLAAGVIEHTVTAMAPPGELLAWLGPCIGAASYEVGEEVRAAFVDADAGADAHFHATRPGHWLADLAGLARRRLHAIGVTRITGGSFDTFTDMRLYSYRRDGAASGRFASLIWR